MLVLITCPNCRLRPADSQLHYDELVRSRYQRTSYRYGRYARSFSSVSQRGEATVCSACAAGYLRMITLRERGLALANRGFLALLGGMVLLALVYSLSAGKGPVISVVVALIGLCALAVLAGSAALVAARFMRHSATRFLRKATGA
jgi:hypothetical protein